MSSDNDLFRVLVYDLSRQRGELVMLPGRRQFIGGSGLAALLYEKYGLPEAAPFDPGQPLIFAIGVVLDLLFQLSLREDSSGKGIGRSCPVLVVLEEAHKYLGEGANPATRSALNRIAREGRKYGIGIMLDLVVTPDRWVPHPAA